MPSHTPKQSSFNLEQGKTNASEPWYRDREDLNEKIKEAIQEGDAAGQVIELRINNRNKNYKRKEYTSSHQLPSFSDFVLQSQPIKPLTPQQQLPESDLTYPLTSTLRYLK